MTIVLAVAKFCWTDFWMTTSSYVTHLDVGLGTDGAKTADLSNAGKAYCGGAGSFEE